MRFSDLRNSCGARSRAGPGTVLRFGGAGGCLYGTAAAHPIEGAHSIWELALHLTGTYGLVLRRLEGDGRRLAPQKDWPEAPAPGAENWNDTIRRLRQLNQDIRRRVSGFPADRLDAPLVAEASYTAYTQFIGITQHDLYHAGQIAVLKRALLAPAR